MDKETEKIVRAIYEGMAKGQAFLDWFWVKREVESQLAGRPPNGDVGIAIRDGLKKAGRL